jgi:hypothetical protein
MTLQIVVLIFIVLLLVYIIYLHIQLAKRNVFIESTVKRLSGIEKNRSMDEMFAFLQEIQKNSLYSSYFKDKLLEEDIINFILEDEKNLKIYIHYTRNEYDAENILKEGFMFAESFYKTALPVTKDKLDLTIKHNSRKYFGDYLIVLGISNDVANYYSMELEKAGIKNYYFENVLTEKLPQFNDNADPVYQLAPHFVKGYINHHTGKIIKNPEFDPYYNSTTFFKNIDLFRSA